MKNYNILFIILTFIIVLFSCDNPTDDDSSINDEFKDINKEMATVFDFYSKAMFTDDPGLMNDFEAYLREFDSKYASDLHTAFISQKSVLDNKFSYPISYPPVTNLPIDVDGAVYLCSGESNVVSYIIKFICPTTTEGEYLHGAALDIDKFDPTNLESPCFQSAGEKGAIYETPMQWMTQSNIAVFNPILNVPENDLNNAQANMDYFCSPENTNMQFGFFEDYINIFKIVTKENNYYWYCTKVVWRLYDNMLINLDSDTELLDWTDSGLYYFVRAYYYAKYWYNPFKAKRKIREYMEKVKTTLVIAEEIYFSPYLEKVYENIRSN